MTWAILLLGLGLALIVAEVLFPSLGMLGVLATLCIVGGGVFAQREGGLTTYMLIAGVCVPLVILLGLKLLPRSPLAKYLVAGGFSTDDNRGVDRRDDSLLGKEGVVEAKLRPAGVARIDGRRVDVVSRGEWIDAGTRVRVIGLEGNRVVVDDAGRGAGEAAPQI